MQAIDDDGHGTAETGHKPTDIPNGELVTGPTRQQEPTHNQDAASRETDNRYVWRRPDLLSLIFDGLIVATGIVGTYFLIDQTRETRRANDLAAQAIAEAREANDIARQSTKDAATEAAQQALRNERQLAVAEESNRLTDHSLSASIEAARLERRAWLGVDKTVRVVVEVGKPIIVGVEIVNSGQTPALDATGLHWLAAGPPGQPFKPVYSPVPNAPSSSAVFPGQRIGGSVSSRAAITERDLTQIKSGAARVYLYGRITYRDIFGQAHETGYCGFLQLDLSTLQMCEGYNYAK